MESLVGLLVIIAIVVIILVINKQNKASQIQRVTRIDAQMNNYYAEVQDFCDKIHELQAIPEIDLPIQMKRGEKGYLQDVALFREQRSKTVSNRGGGAVRVAKGIYIGGSHGVSRSVPEMQDIDSGSIYFTNKRLLFVGQNAVKEYPIKKIITIETSLDGFWIASEGKQKRQFYKTSGNPLMWAVMLNVINQSEDQEGIPHIVIERS